MGLGFISGADHSTASGDGDLTADMSDEERKRRGYVGGGSLGINNNLTQDAGADWNPDGTGEAIHNGYRVAGTSAYDKDVDRYRKMGADGMNRQAAQIDPTQANQSRGLQLGALGMMNQAAQGNAPSRAVEMGHVQNDAAIRAAMMRTGGARGPGAAVAAMNQSQAGAVGQMGQTNAQLTDLRGAEMAKNQSDFANSAQAARGQDITAATTNAQLEATQRSLNENRQESLERLGFDTRRAQSQAADRYARDLANQNDTRTRNQDERDARDWAHLKDDASTAASVGMGITNSDERLKTNMRPVMMGSLSGLSRFMHGRR